MTTVAIVYANPTVTATPVPPLGAARIAAAFAGAGCRVRLLAPFLAEHPVGDLLAGLDGVDLVGFSVRNVDDALVVRRVDGPGPIDTASCLPAIRPLVDVAKQRAPVLLGGAALSTCPVGVLFALGARFGVRGPGEDLAFRIGRAMVGGAVLADALPSDPRVLDVEAGIDEDADLSSLAGPGLWTPAPTPLMGEYTALLAARGGRVPIPYSIGCNRRCGFCVEASFLSRAAVVRSAETVVAEIEAVHARTGLTRFWLAGSELNVPSAEPLKAVLRAVIGKKLDVDLRGFLQPAPVDAELLDLLEAAGIDPASLSWEFGHLDPSMLARGAGPARRAHIDRLVDLYVRRGYRTLGATVILGAHPDETLDTITKAVDAARSIDASLPRGFGLHFAAGGRVYATSPLGRWVRAHPAEAAPDLYGEPSPGFATPLVFCRPMAPRALLRHLIAALSGCRGAIGPLNAEAADDPLELEAERLVQCAIVARHRGNAEAADALFISAREHAPQHREALRQHALLLANELDDPARARHTLTALLALDEGPGRAALEAAIAALR